MMPLAGALEGTACPLFVSGAAGTRMDGMREKPRSVSARTRSPKFSYTSHEQACVHRRSETRNIRAQSLQLHVHVLISRCWKNTSIRRTGRTVLNLFTRHTLAPRVPSPNLWSCVLPSLQLNRVNVSVIAFSFINARSNLGSQGLQADNQA